MRQTGDVSSQTERYRDQENMAWLHGGDGKAFGRIFAETIVLPSRNGSAGFCMTKTPMEQSDLRKSWNGGIAFFVMIQLSLRLFPPRKP
jgi:hypothetical protein